jgi:hypothetical protein
MPVAVRDTITTCTKLDLPSPTPGPRKLSKFQNRSIYPETVLLRRASMANLSTLPHRPAHRKCHSRG